MNRPRVDRADFRRLHDQGLSLPQLAKRFHITERTACRIRKELGIARHSPEAGRRMDDAWRSAAAQMLDDGAPVSEVAATLGCNVETVNRHFPGRAWDKRTTGLHAKAIRTAMMKGGTNWPDSTGRSK